MVAAAYLGMRTGRPKKPLEIVDADREKLNLIARRPKSAQSMAMRARIVLSCGQGMTNSEVARKLHITGATVGKWRRRFIEFGMDGLLDEPRVGAPRKITDQQIEDVVTKTLESMSANSTHWSTRLMAEETGLTQNAIVRIWRAFGLQPHRVENFKFSKDPPFVEKVRDIVGLYLNPPDRAIVLCVDEKSQVQAESDAADSSSGPGCAGAAVARLRAPWSHIAVCGNGCGFRSDHQHVLPAAPASGIPAVSR